MHAAPPATALAAALLAAALLAWGGPALAFEDAQFCVAVKEYVRAATGDVGTWTDRRTRNDGVEIGCDRKVVHFKRYHSAPASALGDTWMGRQAENWESAYCRRSIWREAVANGWIISATVTTVTGERLWLSCLPSGRAFHRVMPRAPFPRPPRRSAGVRPVRSRRLPAGRRRPCHDA